MASKVTTALAAGAVAASVLLVARSRWRRERAVQEAHAAMEAKREAYKDDSGATYTTTVTNAEGLKLFVRVWRADAAAPARAVVVLVHGYTWHSGHYGVLASRLVAQGVAVVAYDTQGHGLSDAHAGLRGYIADFEAAHVEDLMRVTAWARQQFPGAPLFVGGESMGGTAVLRAARRPEFQQTVRGMLLLAPVIRVASAVLPPPAVVAGLIKLSYLFPTMQLPDDSIIKEETWKGAFGDRAFADRAYADPLVTLVLPRLSMVRSLRMYEDTFSHLELIRTPFIVAHAPGDARTEFSNSVALVQRASAADKTLLEAPGGAHMLLFDQPDVTRRVLDGLVAWVVARCSS